MYMLYLLHWQGNPEPQHSLNLKPCGMGLACQMSLSKLPGRPSCKVSERVARKLFPLTGLQFRRITFVVSRIRVGWLPFVSELTVF